MLSIYSITTIQCNSGSRGRAQGVGTPPYQTWCLFETETLTSTGSYITFLTMWFFSMKRTLHFATKINSRYIQKCNCFLGTFLCSVLLSISCTNSNRCNTWSSLLQVICHKKVSTVLSEFSNVWSPPPPPPPNKKFLDPPLHYAYMYKNGFPCNVEKKHWVDQKDQFTRHVSIIG